MQLHFGLSKACMHDWVFRPTFLLLVHHIYNQGPVHEHRLFVIACRVELSDYIHDGFNTLGSMSILPALTAQGMYTQELWQKQQVAHN